MARAHERGPERAVVTPSVADVARPVHREAVGRWRPYARHLERIAPWLHAHRARYGYA